MDMGAEYHFYGSDITCSYPVSTSKSRHLSVPYFSVYYLDLFVPFFFLLKETTLLLCVFCAINCFICVITFRMQFLLYDQWQGIWGTYHVFLLVLGLELNVQKRGPSSATMPGMEPFYLFRYMHVRPLFIVQLLETTGQVFLFPLLYESYQPFVITSHRALFSLLLSHGVWLLNNKFQQHPFFYHQHSTFIFLVFRSLSSDYWY